MQDRASPRPTFVSSPSLGFSLIGQAGDARTRLPIPRNFFRPMDRTIQ
jgi:hypothetical protein